MVNHQDPDNLISLILAMVILIGVFGNMLNLIVFSNKTMRKKSTYQYLFYLSAIDLLVLMTCTTDSLLAYGYFIMIRLKSSLICKIHTFLTYFLTHMSSLIHMIVSIDRALIIKNQSTKNEIINCQQNIRTIIINKSGKLITMLSLILVLCNSHYLVLLSRNSIENDIFLDYNRSIVETKTKLIYNQTSLGIDYCEYFQRNAILRNHNNHNNFNSSRFYICYPKDQTNYYYFISKIWIWIDLVIYSLMPFLIMIICSSIIIQDIKEKSRNFLKTKDRKNLRILEKSKHRNRKMVIMLSITNLFFLFCSLPLCISIILKKFNTNKQNENFCLISFQIISYLNNSFSFMFYLLFSEEYRQALASIFFRWAFRSEKKRAKKSNINSKNQNIYSLNPSNNINIMNSSNSKHITFQTNLTMIQLNNSTNM